MRMATGVTGCDNEDECTTGEEVANDGDGATGHDLNDDGSNRMQQ